MSLKNAQMSMFLEKIGKVAKKYIKKILVIFCGVLRKNLRIQLLGKIL